MSSLSTFPGIIPDWSNLEVLHRNEVPPRANFYNYASEPAALSFSKSEAEYESLNGDWRFHYDASPFDAPPWDEADPTSWETIEVPGHWQRQGYGRPHYTNINYPFPVSPPNVSYLNPTGSYWREFEVPERWDGQSIRVRFEGVDSAFHVFVNDEEVGYSQGARNPAEFDITEYLNDGENNTLAARVYQWSDGSYLEDQDQWWLSGIFRDVYLIPFADTSIQDFHVVPNVADDFASGYFRFNITTAGDNGSISAKLLSPSGEELEAYEGAASSNITMNVSGDDFHLWSAESPILYTVVLNAGDQYISHKVGFHRVELSGPNMLVNGEPIIIYGVNRHEHNSESGRTVPYEAMRADMIRMKQNNINAIRAAHQPHHPDFFDLADELGFYIIAEADLECHGFNDINDTVYGASQWTSNNTEWTDAYIDRAEQLVDRLRNHVSIIIWSLGNECYYGQNHVEMYEWIHETDPTRLVHYEPDQNATSTDMYSHMYPSLEDMDEQVANFTDKFYILCEFAHAMGNGPGGLLEYINKFRTEPLMQGGLVWEWSNHGLRHVDNGTEFYAYGGDFGDEPNDADFIMDGLTLSDHTPMPSLYEYAKVIQPVQVMLSNDSTQMHVRNWYDFRNLSHLDATWRIVQDNGNNGSAQTPLNISVAAGETATLPVPVNRNSLSNEAWLMVEFALREDHAWADAGHIVAWEQLYLNGTMAGQSNNTMEARSMPILGRQSEANMNVNGTMLNVESGGSTFGFDLVRGNVTWNANGVDILNRGPELYFYRAMTQNDLGQSGDAEDWDEAWVHSMRTQVRDVFWEDTGDALEVRYNVRVAPQVLEWGAEADITYTIPHDSGSISIHAQGDFVGNNTPEVLPRIGLLAHLNEDFDDVSWFGRGPGENYPDTKSSQGFGEWVSSVDDLFTYYDYPQENGNRGELRWLQIGTSDGGVTLDARMDGEPFAFTAKRVSDYDLNDAQHPHDLQQLNMTILNLDYRNHGVGSATVGPRPFEPYKCYSGPFDFTFHLSLV